MNTDVIIVGGGISGLTLSYLLKERNVDHLVLNRVMQDKTLDLAETMPPSALVLLQSLGLLELFSKSSSKTFGYQSLWHSSTVTTDNFFYHNPFKYGLKLAKTHLLKDMSELVKEHIIEYHKLNIHSSKQSIAVELATKQSIQKVNARLIVDATGRNRSVLNHFGVSTQSFDYQVAFSCHVPFFKHPDLIHQVFVESFENGWGIVSSLNEEINVITLYTGKGSPLIPLLKDYKNWKEVLKNTRFLNDFLSEHPLSSVVNRNANSSKASQISGSNWLAIGDAAIAFDPISSHGFSNAIYCAKSASQAISSYLNHPQEGAIQDYDNTLSKIFEEYIDQKSRLYEGV